MINIVLNYILIFLWIIFFITIVNIIFIFPSIFYFSIIPKIEKKIGKRLEFNNITGGYFPRWTMSVPGVAAWIATKYLLKKPKKRDPRTMFVPLLETSYDIRYASRIEIVVSILAMINSLIFIITGILLFLMVKFGIR
jgi:hypothetical protein